MLIKHNNHGEQIALPQNMQMSHGRNWEMGFDSFCIFILLVLFFCLNFFFLPAVGDTARQCGAS